MPFQIPNNEEKRIEALRRYDLLDTPAEQSFDDFAYLASQICNTPIAAVTLVDSDRQWFKAKVGLEASETPREHSFCTHAILTDKLMIVEDATADTRFVDNPLVTSEPNIRFYAGAPLIDIDGFGLGSLCVIDCEPRQLTPGQQKALEALARQVVAQCEFRRISADLAATLADVKALRGLLPICSHCKNIRDDKGYWRSVETYIAAHTEAEINRSLCTQCLRLHFPDVYTRLLKEGKVQPDAAPFIPQRGTLR
jgi:hypothetical protein